MNVNGIGRSGYSLGYETRRTETNITSKNNAGEDEVYNEGSSNIMQSNSQDCLKNDFMDTYMRYIKETGRYAVRADNINEVSEPHTEGTEIEYQQFIQEYIEKLFVKIENGDIEDTYQIGKSSFTLKEWEKFLEKFDSAEDALKRLVDKESEEAKAMRTEATGETQEADSITNMQMNMLVSETVQARFPLQEVDEEGKHKEEMYLIAVDKDGIHCSKAGQDKYEWEILFTTESQYENATEFLNYAGEFMDNFLFAAHENFWEDYLNGNMDVDAFKEFLEGTNNGIPDYSFTVGDSMYIDKEKVQWAQYMNPLGAKFYTAEEMAQMQAELIEKNTATFHKLSDPYSMLYKKLHPEYNGERIFCEYPGGPLYTADEIMEIMNRNSKDAKYQAEARK